MRLKEISTVREQDPVGTGSEERFQPAFALGSSPMQPF